MPYRPVALYGLTVPAGDEPVIAVAEDEYPCTFRITMAAIDPSAAPLVDDDHTGPIVPRATLKMIRIPDDSDDEDDEDEYDDEELAALLGEDSDEDDEESSGGPSDPSKSLKAQRRAALLAALKEEAEKDDDMEVDTASKLKVNGKGKGKGKAVVAPVDEEEDDEEDDLDAGSDESEIPDGAEEFVICTLDPTKNFQQPLDITVNEHERVLFVVSGTHSVYLTGNILYDEDERAAPDYYDDEDDEEDEYDLSPGEEDLDMDDYSEEDELDDIDDPRIQEIDSDEEEAPALVPTKGKNKRAAEEAADATPEKAKGEVVNGDAKLSKSQLKKMKKKLKDNAGNAIEVSHTKEGDESTGTKETLEASKVNSKGDKKVQFAKTLVQGPTASTTQANGATPPKKPTTGVKVVQGVTVDDKKIGSGPQAKAGDRVSMRYIGKLEKDKKVFDSNKKGPPFSFKLGKGEVIKGWDIGVAGMQVGGERRITIPAHLAYGSKRLPDIPANSTLVFDLKVLEIKK